MVKASKSSKAAAKSLAQQLDEQREEFVEASEYLINDNDNEENLNERSWEDKDDQLIEKLKSIDFKKGKRLRTEFVTDELDVTINNAREASHGVHKIKTHELLHSLKDLADTAALKKAFAKAHKRTKVLDTPLPKHVTEKAQRIAVYAEDKKEVSKWEPTVKKNRKSEQLVFPLKQPNYAMQTTTFLGKTWQPETELEKQVAELLQTSENNLKDQKLLTQTELKAVQTMNLDEMKQKRAEFLKLKALQKYQEAKFKRLKHIKSKRYRKILRKEKEKQEEKNLSKLESEDPVQFKEVLDQLEKKRMKERMSLKHKNTSKWAKQQGIYAKYSDKSRDLVQEQLEISKQLTKKVKQLEYDNKDADDEKNAAAAEQQDETTGAASGLTASMLGQRGLLANNPWMKMMSGVGGAVAGDEAAAAAAAAEKSSGEYGQPKAFVNKLEKERAQREAQQRSDQSDDDSDSEIENKSGNKAMVDILNADEDNDDDNDDNDDNNNKTAAAETEKKANSERRETSGQLDTDGAKSKKSASKRKSQSGNSDNTTTGAQPTTTEAVSKNIEPIGPGNFKTHDDDDDDKDQDANSKPASGRKQSKSPDSQLTLSEAFADDDVIEEFKMDKKAAIEKEKVKSIDLSMPGWGGWSGAGIDPKLAAKKKQNQNRRARQRNGGKQYRKPLVIRPQDVVRTQEDKEQLTRRDKDLEHVIISEKKDTKIAAFQINQLPHQFNNVEDFENKIAQPIGRTWNPDYKFRKLTLPRVKTKVGAIIDPIDRDDIVTNTKKNKK